MKEKATDKVRLFPSTRKRLKIRSIKENVSLAKLVDQLSKEKEKERVS